MGDKPISVRAESPMNTKPSNSKSLGHKSGILIIRIRVRGQPSKK